VSSPSFKRDVAIIGGAGHVGLPLALTFADCGMKTVIYDIDAKKLEKIRAGKMPFMEEGGQETLDRVLKGGNLELESKPNLVSECKFLILIIGTPIDEHLNPGFNSIHRAINDVKEHLRDGQIMVLRSTVFPGITKHIQRFVRSLGKNITVSFCPERVAEGKSIKEFRELPQIVSGFDQATIDAVKTLFGKFTPEFIEMQPMEAELAKLMTNSWRYIQFATVNQFYMIAAQNGLNFDRILHGCRHNYPRMAGMPGPGFAAGPCLVKDTMQLAAFSNNTFALGHAAMLINEGLPGYLVEMAKRNFELWRMTAGILGMAFKGESDDPRDSLAYKLRKLLLLEAHDILCTDPYVQGEGFVSVDEVIARSQILFVATPHKAYRNLRIPEHIPVYDVWSCVSPAERQPYLKGTP